MRNFKGIDRCIFGKGTFSQLGDILDKRRQVATDFAVILVDKVFEAKELGQRARQVAKAQDLLIFVNVSDYEPKTEQIDQIVSQIKAFAPALPVSVVGIGGGSIMDIAKATSLMLTNPGKSEQYQGLDLIKIPGVHCTVVPTLAGTGAEVSMTAVLTGPVKKLGLKCDYTVPDQVLLDPDIIRDAPEEQRFYTAMDCYIHAVEALDGSKRNTFSDAYGQKSLEMCQEVFLGDLSREEADEKLMIASYLGGLSLTYSQVGVCHALSYGLSYVLGTRHGEANCIVFYHLQDYYGKYVLEFREMLKKHHITLRQGITRHLSEADMEKMVDVAYALDHMWDHAFGPDWKSIMTRDKIKALYQLM